MPLSFSKQDLKLFCRASGDRNPLHNDPLYAQKTSFGEPVVFGALGVLAALGTTEPGEQLRICGIRADFHRPMFVGVHYEFDHSRQPEKVIVRLKDGSVPVLTATFSLSDVGAEKRTGKQDRGEPLFLSAAAQHLAWATIRRGDSFSGRYKPDAEFVEHLMVRWRINEASPALISSVLWSSYLIGMEIPGENALFFSAAIDLRPASAAAGSELHYTATVKDKNEGRSQLRLIASLTDGEVEVGTAQLTAFYRPQIESNALLPSESARSNREGGPLSSRTAVLIGGSRGFGAAVAVALAGEGMHVVICARSKPDWLEETPAEIGSQIVFELSDAADREALSQVQERVRQRFGAVDVLISLACPPIPSLRLEANAIDRVNSYLSKANELVVVPICTFLPALAESRGMLVLISSEAVEHPVREWPHYVAAKASAEMLVRVAGMQYPEISTLIFRPERMLTEMTNTPMGRVGAASPVSVAKNLVQQILELRTGSSARTAMEEVPA